VNLSEVRFPVYNIRNVESIFEEDKILYAETLYNTYVIDNRNLAGNTMGKRRLRVQDPLYTFGESADNLLELVTGKWATKVFVDANGMRFKNYKTTYCLVRTYGVKTIHGANVAEVHGTSIPYRVKNCLAYVQLLHTSNQGRLVYGTVDEYKEDFKVWI